MRRRAVVIGAGIGGLAAAAGLHQAGWKVTVCERAAELEPIGAGLAVAPNGLRALDTIGAGQAVRALATSQELGIRRWDGLWMMRSSGRALAARFGDPVVLLSRSALVDVLLARVPAGALRLSTTVSGVRPGDERSAATVLTSAGDLEADLVVAADGIGSLVRAIAFGDHDELRYAGFTTWRMLTGLVGDQPAGSAGPVAAGPVAAGPVPAGPVPMAESWGRGAIFGIMPLADGRVYCYAAARAPAGGQAADELAELRGRFENWHQPIGELLGSVTADRVLRHDVAELARPLPAYHQGRVALLGDAAHPMTPNLGQGGSQALEDATVLARIMRAADADTVPRALAGYTAVRLPRASAIVSRSRQVARVALMAAPVSVATRDAAARVVGRLAPNAGVRGLAPIYGWQPPDEPLLAPRGDRVT